MSLSLELAMMLDCVAEMSSNASMRKTLRDKRDDLLRAVPAELAHEAKMSKWLFDELNKPTITGGPIEFPIHYE